MPEGDDLTVHIREEGPMSTPTLDDLDAADGLRALARAVVDGDLCSLLFGVFLRSFQEDTGHEPGYWPRKIAATIEATGRHHTAREIAAILEARAKELEAAAP